MTGKRAAATTSPAAAIAATAILTRKLGTTGNSRPKRRELKVLFAVAGADPRAKEAAIYFIILLYEVPVYQTRELKHVHLLFTIEYRFKGGISLNVLFILEIMLFDVLPKFLGEFSSRQGI